LAGQSSRKEEAYSNWVAYFNNAQSWEGTGAGVLLVSPTGQLHKYAIQLAFPREGCGSSTVECEGLLASLRIAARMGFSRLFIRGDSQLTAGHAKGAEFSPLMKAYAGEMRKLECRFHSLKLEHVPCGQDAVVKELS
jgi:hypothetical protein